MKPDERAARLKRLFELGPEHPAVTGLLDFLRYDCILAAEEMAAPGLAPEERAWLAGYARRCQEFLGELERGLRVP